MNGPREELASWLEKADADLRAARVLRDALGLPLEIAAFHYQQAAEKALKGLLVDAGIAPPRTHDLRALLALFPERPPGIEQEIAEQLTPFAVIARYPGLTSRPDSAIVDRFEVFSATCIDRLRECVEMDSGPFDAAQ